MRSPSLSIADPPLAAPSLAAPMAKIASTDKRQVWLERSCHVATLDHHADPIATETAAFVRRVASQPPEQPSGEQQRDPDRQREQDPQPQPLQHEPYSKSRRP
jgi:hypothetical protein